ncbi:MAG: tRNA (N6-threonylcarbamoyladenosine(37)-N6)-methyltransferase TrmO [Ruminococcus sp.]|nr:tRNA (N6-threonylcarbamoyladenosine(37)-N6)-methyltransferase TrmO [Ruminococcus sp.]
MNGLNIKPIAVIRTDFGEKFGIPRQSGRAPSARGRIIFEPEYRSPEALRGMEGFSHLWLIFDFSECHREGWSPTVRPPRLGGNRRIGVFASRSPFRPNPLGLSCVKLEGLEQTPNEGTVLLVSGCDLLDGTPIFDIKPYLPSADIRADAIGGYADEFTGHRLRVTIPPEAAKLLPEGKLAALLECLADDPRPSYIDDPERIYGMRYAGYNVRFRVEGDELEVVGIERE